MIICAPQCKGKMCGAQQATWSAITRPKSIQDNAHSICQLWSSTYIKSWCVPMVIAARAIPKICFNLLKPAESLQPRKRMTNMASSWHLRLWFWDVIHVAVKIIPCCLSLAVKIKSKFTQLCNPTAQQQVPGFQPVPEIETQQLLWGKTLATKKTGMFPPTQITNRDGDPPSLTPNSPLDCP